MFHPPELSVDSPAMRQAGADVLSLALMDARNHTLRLLTCFEQALAEGHPGAVEHNAFDPSCDPPLWLAGHIGWFAEYWIGRNTQRGRGAACAQAPTRLASIEPRADAWWHPAQPPHAGRFAADLPDAASTRAWLLETLESTLELLEKTADDDAALYFYRLALFHEDLRGEQLVTLAQTLGLPLKMEAPPLPAPRAPLLLPPTRWTLGQARPGFQFDNEVGEHEVQVPEFEIDAQAVSWAQYVEFAGDGGYDRPELWTPAGWRWLEQQVQLEGRRGPRHVEEIGTASGAVTQMRFGRRVRMAPQQAASHVSWWEADAWARWAGRRLATEVEWEVAAHTAGARGFRWGEVHEWTATTFRPWPGFVPGPWADYCAPWFGHSRVLRGASFATRARMRHPRQRGFALPERDDHFAGFRTCSL